MEYIKALEREYYAKQEGRSEGFNEGLSEGREEGILIGEKRALEKFKHIMAGLRDAGKSTEEIAEICQMPLEEVLSILSDDV